MEYKQIIYQPGKVARVILNRPRYRNAQSKILLDEMDDAFKCAVTDKKVDVIVLSGAGDHFSAGHDLGTPEEVEDRQARGQAQDGQAAFIYARELFLEKTLRWRNLPKPTIAMVKGYCIFAGWMIAAAMDIIFASEEALFLPAHFQCFSAPWDVGPRKAKELIFENRYLTAQEACECGFVSRVYPKDKLEQESLAFADRVAENDPFSLRLTKFSINHMMDTMGFTSEMEAGFQINFIRRYLENSTYARRENKSRKLANSDTAMENLKLSKKQIR